MKEAIKILGKYTAEHYTQKDGQKWYSLSRDGKFLCTGSLKGCKEWAEFLETKN